MRTNGGAKMGYFPTPPTMVDKIMNRLSFTGRSRLFDPCCGEGDALLQISEAAPQSMTYGIELDKYRAQQASTRLSHVVSCGYERARVEQGCMHLLFMNPPYDNQSGIGGLEMRKELIFLRDLAKYQSPDGVLVFIIPRYTLGSELVNALLHRYTDLAIYRFDDEEYRAFKQVVVFGKRRSKNLTTSRDMNEADRNTKNELLAYGKDAEIPMPYLDTTDGRTWTVPAEQDIEVPILFRGYILDEDEMMEDLLHSEAFKIAENLLMVDSVQAKLKRPLLPYRRTHMATLISAGALNGAVGIRENRHMVVGMTRKIVNREVVRNDDGSETIIDTENFTTAVRIVQPNGRIINLQ